MIVNELDVEATPGEVFDQVADLRGEAAWNPATRRVDLVSAELVGLGSRYRASWRGIGTADGEIVEFNRPTHWRTRCRARAMSVDVVGDVRPTNTGTHLTLTLELTAHGALRRFELVLAAGLRAASRANMRRLTALLESPYSERPLLLRRRGGGRADQRGGPLSAGSRRGRRAHRRPVVPLRPDRRVGRPDVAE